MVFAQHNEKIENPKITMRSYFECILESSDASRLFDLLFALAIGHQKPFPSVLRKLSCRQGTIISCESILTILHLIPSLNNEDLKLQCIQLLALLTTRQITSDGSQVHLLKNIEILSKVTLYLYIDFLLCQ